VRLYVDVRKRERVVYEREREREREGEQKREHEIRGQGARSIYERKKNSRKDLAARTWGVFWF